jgi:hypothetical protein
MKALEHLTKRILADRIEWGLLKRGETTDQAVGLRWRHLEHQWPQYKAH